MALNNVKQATADVLVVGAGPAGLALAVDLARRGVDTLLGFLTKWLTGRGG